MSRISRRILFLEPVESVRKAVAAHLVSHGFEVESVDREDEALRRLTGGGFGVVLIDVALEGRRGFPVVEHITQRIPELLTRIVVITADDSEKVRHELALLGVCEVVPKPIRADEILQAVRDCLQSAEAALH